MAEITVFEMTMTGHVFVRAADLQDAIDKTLAYFAGHINELDYQASQETVVVPDEGG